MSDLVAAVPDGLDPDKLMAAIEDPGSRVQLDAANADAIASSCFGGPWLLADEEAYFGQDRLDMLERRLAA